MSRGLGSVQRRILERLRACDGWCALGVLTAWVFHPERWEWRGRYYWRQDPGAGEYGHTRAEYVSCQRAVISLERRVLVEARKRRGSPDGSGGATHWKQVRLCVADVAK